MRFRPVCVVMERRLVPVGFARRCVLSAMAVVLTAGCSTVAAQTDDPAPSERTNPMTDDSAPRKPSGAEAPMPGETISGTGTVVAGVECPQIEMDDGYSVSIQSAPAPASALPPGTRVQITATAVLLSSCMQGAAVAITQLEIL